MHKAPLARRTPLARTSRLRPRSRKTAAAYKERRKFVAAMLADSPRCDAALIGCQGRAVDVHEHIARSHGGSILPDAKAEAQGQRFWRLCRMCHSWLTDHPAEARRLGFSQ